MSMERKTRGLTISNKRQSRQFITILLFSSLMSCLTGTTSSHVPLPGNYYYGLPLLSPSSSQSSSPTSSSTSHGQQGSGRSSFPSYLFPSSTSSSSFLSSLSSSSKNIPSSSSSSSSSEPVLADRPNRGSRQYPRIPSCSELREMWMKSVSTSYTDHWSMGGPTGKFGMIHTNEIPKFVPPPNNPYYYNLLSSRNEPIFGSMKHSKEPQDGLIPVVEGTIGQAKGDDDTFGLEVDEEKDVRQHGHGQEEEVYGTIEKSGSFHDRPASASELGPVFGHVIVGPSGEPSLAGTFGSFSSSPAESGSKSRDRQSTSRITSSAASSSSRERSSASSSAGSRRRGQRTTSSPRGRPSSPTDMKSDTKLGESLPKSSSSSSSSYPRRQESGLMTANDFFGAGWHEKPAVVVGSTNV